MRIPVLVIVAALLGASSLTMQAQAPANARSSPNSAQSTNPVAPQAVSAAASGSSPAAAAAIPAPPPPLPPPPPPSDILRPALSTVQLALIKVHIERWKKGSIRDEASADVESLQREIQVTLPPMLRDADASPAALSKTLLVERHVDALYDVLLRVLEGARFAGPDEQATQLRDALGTLGDARLQLSQRMADTAAGQEKQLSDLRAVVVKQAGFKCPAPPPEKPCPQAAPPKRTVKKKPATTANPQGTGNPQSKPNQPPSANQKNPQNQQNQQNQQKPPNK